MSTTEGRAGERARLRSEGTVALTKELFERFSQLARKEVELARRELRVDAGRGIIAGVLGGVAAAAAVSALVCGLVAVISALGVTWSAWAVALVGLALFAIVGGVFAWLAVGQARTARPRRTIREARATLGLLQRLRRPPGDRLARR
jgi:hypothetical protein